MDHRQSNPLKKVCFFTVAGIFIKQSFLENICSFFL
jgi:hypothetical protein